MHAQRFCGSNLRARADDDDDFDDVDDDDSRAV